MKLHCHLCNKNVTYKIIFLKDYSAAFQLVERVFLRFSFKFRARDTVLFGEDLGGLKGIARCSRIFLYNSYRIGVCLSESQRH